MDTDSRITDVFAVSNEDINKRWNDSQRSFQTKR